jgi:hypothetical protein
MFFGKKRNKRAEDQRLMQIELKTYLKTKKQFQLSEFNKSISLELKLK